MQPTMGDPAQQAPHYPGPPLVVPMTNCLAIQDPTTGVWQNAARQAAIRLWVGVPVLAALAALRWLDADLYRSQSWEYEVVPFYGALLLWTIGYGIVLARRASTAKGLLSRYPWRPVGVELVSGGAGASFVVRTLGADSVVLRLRRGRWLGAQSVLRTGRIWLCGPDEQGRSVARVDGSIGMMPVRLLPAVPEGRPPVALAVPTSPRPADDPGVASLLRRRGRAMRTVWLILAALFVLSIADLAVFGNNDSDGSNDGFIGLGVVVLLLVIIFALAFLLAGGANRRTKRLLRRAQGWTAMPVRLSEWSPTRGLLGPAFGTVQLPDGSYGNVEMKTAGADLVANIQAGQTLWVAGYERPANPRAKLRVVAGQPGLPVFHLATITFAGF